MHHTASPTLDAMLEEVLAGCAQEGLESVEVRAVAALRATPSDVLEADGLVLGTPANMGYMAGALKVFFDGCYYPLLRETPGLPYGLYVHGNNDVEGAVRSVETLATGLRWQRVSAPVAVVGPLDGTGRAALRDLSATVAASLL